MIYLSLVNLSLRESVSDQPQTVQQSTRSQIVVQHGEVLFYHLPAVETESHLLCRDEEAFVECLCARWFGSYTSIAHFSQSFSEVDTVCCHIVLLTVRVCPGQQEGRGAGCSITAADLLQESCLWGEASMRILTKTLRVFLMQLCNSLSNIPILYVQNLNIRKHIH